MKRTSKPILPPDALTIRALRKAKGWSVYRLAAESGVLAPYLGRVERGLAQRMSLDVARKLCRALGVSLAVFDEPA